MKRLNEFINEHLVNEENETSIPESKVFTFELKDLEDTKTTIEALNNLDEKPGIEVTVEDTKVTINITKEGIENTEDVKKIISDFIADCNHSGHRAGSELYAERLAKLEKELASIDEYIANVKGEAEKEKEESNASKTDDNKSEDEKDKSDDKSKETGDEK